jgi:3-oxoacyl-[acyl-carrier protein] reductase
VAVNYASSREGAERVVADIKVNGGEAIAVKGDVAKAADVRRLFDETRSAFGRVDVLVNNAGIYHFQPLEDITEDEFHLQFNTNVLGTILAAKEAAKHFGPDGGSIINISSVASEQALPTATVASPTISPASPCFWPPTMPPGSPASGSPRRAGITETRRVEYRARRKPG